MKDSSRATLPIEVEENPAEKHTASPEFVTIGDVEQEAPDDKTRYAAIADH